MCVCVKKCVNMSNWLGFSLTPHLRIDEEFERENQERGGGYHHPSPSCHPHLSVMPLRSDGSLCVADSFSHSAASQGIACHPTLFYLHPWPFKFEKNNCLLSFFVEYF